MTGDFDCVGSYGRPLSAADIADHFENGAQTDAEHLHFEFPTDSNDETITKHQISLVRLWEQPEPAEMQFLVEDTLPEGFPSLLYAHSGTGKSYLVLILTICVCLGRPFLGRTCLKRKVLYLDTELNRDEMARRMYQVSRGMGLTQPPEGLFYLRAEFPLGDTRLVKQVRRYVEKHEIGLVIVDSLSIGATASDVSNQRDAVSLMKSLEGWGTVLCIDHISKAAAHDPSTATAFGSTFKRGFARSVLNLYPGEDGARSLAHDKSNFGPLSKTIHFVMLFEESPRRSVSVRLLGADDDRIRQPRAKEKAVDRSFKAIEQLYADLGRPVTYEELATKLRVAETTVANYVGQLRDRVQTFGNKTCAPLTTHNPLENVSE